MKNETQIQVTKTQNSDSRRRAPVAKALMAAAAVAAALVFSGVTPAQADWCAVQQDNSQYYVLPYHDYYYYTGSGGCYTDEHYPTFHHFREYHAW